MGEVVDLTAVRRRLNRATGSTETTAGHDQRRTDKAPRRGEPTLAELRKLARDRGVELGPDLERLADELCRRGGGRGSRRP